MSLPSRFGHTDHDVAVYIISMGVLTLSQCGKAVSLDKRLFNRELAYSHSGSYTWPIRLIQLLWISVFFSSGISKLMAVGPEWIENDFFIKQIIWSRYIFSDGIPSEQMKNFGVWIFTAFPATLIACSVLAIELASPLALIRNRLGHIITLSMTGFIIGVRIFIGIGFLPLIFLALFFVPWDVHIKKMNIRFFKPFYLD